MPRYILKINDCYFEYSTIVDAPVSAPMSRDAFIAYYTRTNLDVAGLNARLDRVDTKGTSALDYDSWQDVIACNRAGLNESEWSPEQFMRWVQNPDVEPTP